MKNVLVLVVAMFVCGNLFSQGIEFEHGTLNEALAKAKKENKLLFMDCYTTWCGPCKYLAKDIFPQKEVGDYFNQHFVSIKMDMEKGEGIDLCTKYQVKSFPSLLFLDFKGNNVHKLVGGMPVEELIAGAKCALDPNLRIGTLRRKYEDGNREYDFLMTYLASLKRQYDRENIALVAANLMKKYSFEKFVTKDLFFVVAGAKIKYGSDEYQYLLKNKEAITVKVDSKEFDLVIEKAIKTHLSEYVQTCKSWIAIENEINKCEKVYVFSYLDEFKKQLKYEFYIANDQLQEWFDLKLQDADKFKGGNFFYAIHIIVDDILKNPKLSSSKEIIDRILKMGHKLVEQEQGVITGNFLLSKFYLKKGDKAKALKHYNLFYENNEKAGGNNTHPSVSNMKKAIDSL
jgi:thioredoxin-related protein